MSSALKQRALRGAVWAGVGGNGAQALAFVMFVLISRVVGPEAFGAVAVALLMIEICRAFTSECVAVNLVARGRFDKHSFDAGFGIAVPAAIAVSLLLAAAAPLVALVFNIAALERVVPQLAPLLAIHAFARLFEAELTVRMEFRALAIRAVSAVSVGGVVGIASAYAGYGVEALILQQWTAALVSLVLLGVQARWRPGFTYPRDVLYSLARQSALMAPAGLITSVRHSLDGLAVASFSGAAAAGLYNLAKRTRLALQLGLTAAIGRVSLPTFGKVKEDPARLSSALQQALRLSAIVAFPVFVGVAAVAPELIDVFLGAEWAGAAAPMALLMIGGAIAIATRLCENLLLVCGRRSAIVAVNAAAAALLAILVALVGRQGPLAVAGAVLFVGVAQNLASWTIASRYAPGLTPWTYIANVLTPMAICIAMLALLAGLRETGAAASVPEALRLMLFTAVGAAFYAGAAWLFARAAVRSALSATRIALSAGKT